MDFNAAEALSALEEFLASDTGHAGSHLSDIEQETYDEVRPMIQEYADTLQIPDMLMPVINEIARVAVEKFITTRYDFHSDNGATSLQAFYTALAEMMTASAEIVMADSAASLQDNYGRTEQRTIEAGIKPWQQYLSEVDCESFQTMLADGLPTDAPENMIEWAYDNKLELSKVLDIFSHVSQIGLLYNHGYLVKDTASAILKLYGK